MRKTIKLMAVMLLASASAGVIAQEGQNQWLDKVVALVDSDVILDSEFKRRYRAISEQLKSSDTPLPPEEELKDQVLEKLISDSIQGQMAQRAGIRISDAELNAAIERIAESNQTTVKGMREDLAKEGVNFALFREDIRQEMMRARLRQGSIARKVFVSEQEVEDLLAIIEEQGATNVQYRLRHFMIAISESAGPEDVDAARQKAQSVIQRFREGADFATMVVAESDGSDALTGGDFGWRNIEQIPSLFAGSIRNLEVGQLSEPIRSPNGLHILKLEEKQGGLEKQMVDEVNLRHILVEVSAVMTDEQARLKLEELREQIKNGASFEELAKVHSEDLGSANLGGDLGWTSTQVFEPVFKEKVDAMEDGELSEPFKGANGWHLVERVGSRSTDQTDEVKKMRARRILQARKFEEEQENWLREIRQSAYVKILHKDA